MHADRCQIFTDVEGVFTADPRKIPEARKLKEITYDEMLELATLARRFSITVPWKWQKIQC